MMFKYLKHTIKVLLILFLSAFILDKIYSYVYINSIPLNKVQYLYSLKNKELDYIFIGSSRVENSIIANQIEKKTNKIVVNLGVKGLKLKDINCVVKLLEDFNIKYEKIFIQVDYSFNNEEEFSKFFNHELLPLVNISNLNIDNYLKNTNDSYFYTKYLPFYKYINADQLVGFRKLVASLKNKPTDIVLNKGFEPKIGKSLKEPEKIPDFILNDNKYLNEINKLFINKKNKIIYFSAPVFNQIKNLNYFDKLKNKIPQVHNFHNAIVDKKYFYDTLHLNNEGAEVFTNILIEKLNL